MQPNMINQEWKSWGDVIITDDEDRVFDISHVYFLRCKNNEVTYYQPAARIAAGSLREIYAMHPLSHGKFKAIKISLPDHLNSQKESRILHSLNSHGRQTGISKPDKAFFILPSGVQVQVMPKYHQSLLNYLVDDGELDVIEALKKSKISEQQVIQILKQISSGLIYLKERAVYHGDIDLRNILCSWSVPIRFDLADFEDGVDFSQVNHLDDLFNQISKQSVDEFKRICADYPAYSDAQKLELCKRWLISQDALSFAMMLEYSFVHLLKNEFNLRLLHRMIALINETQSLEGVFEILQQMRDPLELTSTVHYYTKSIYEIKS